MIKLKDIINESTILNLFEQAEQPDGKITKSGIGGRDKAIASWFSTNKANTVKNFNTIGAGIGGKLTLPLESSDWGTYGAGVQLILDQMRQAYQVNSFNTDGTPNTKVTDKRNQWDTTVELIPIKIQGGDQIVTSIDAGMANSIDSWSRPDRFKSAGIQTRLNNINAFNIRQWKSGNAQIVNLVPEQIELSDLGTSHISMAKSILKNPKNNNMLYRNKAVPGSLKQQLVIYSPYAQTFQKGSKRTPAKIIPGESIDDINVGDGFVTAGYTLKPQAKANIEADLAKLVQEITDSGIPLDQIPTITIAAGTDREPIGKDAKANGLKDNKDLAKRRANTIKALMVAAGIPDNKIVINTDDVNKGGNIYSYPRDATNAQKIAIRNQWRIDNAPFRFVRMSFPGLKINGGVIKGKESGVDRFISSKTYKSAGSMYLQQDAKIYKLTLNLIKP